MWIKALEDKPKDKASYMDEKYKDAVNMKQTMKMTNAFRKIIFLCFKCKCLLLGKNATNKDCHLTSVSIKWPEK